MGVPKQLSERSRDLVAVGPLASGRRTGRVLAGMALAVLATASIGEAQERAAPDASAGLLRGWSDAPKALEHPASPEEQLRAIARLGATDDQRARGALTLAVATHLSEGRTSGAPQGPSAERGRLRIALARALARHTAHLDARRSLGRLMMGALGSADARDTLAAGIAATALSSSGTADSLEALGRALTQNPPLSDVARAALLAHPPVELAPLLRSGASNRALIELLADLGDQRAFLPLREVVRTGPEALRGPAALALFRLGALETQAWARHTFQKSRVPSERLAALQILVESGDEFATAALSDVLSGKDALAQLDPSTEHVAVDLAARAPRDAWRPLLVEKTRSADLAVKKSAFLALARLGGTQDVFARALAGHDALLAAQALAQTSAPAQDGMLVRALDSQPTRAWALRVLGVRLRRGSSETARAAFARVAAQASKGTPVERAAAAWSVALLHPERASAWVASRDEAVRNAVLRQAFQGPLALAAAQKLAKLSPEEASWAAALSPCLLDAEARGLLSTRVLASLPERDSAPYPAVAAVLAERSAANAPLPGPARPDAYDVRRWLGSAEPELRAATARGLGDSLDMAAVGMLSDLYLFEPDARVRRAAVRALAKRPGASRLRTLDVARDIDPDAAVRALAALTVAPNASQTSDGLTTLTWLASPDGALRLSSAWGETLFAFPDPDGFVGVVDFGPEPVTSAAIPLSEPAVAKLRSARDPSP